MASDGLLVCESCGRQVEVCAFCEDEDCAEVCCYRCLTVDLGEAIRAPHEHGG